MFAKRPSPKSGGNGEDEHSKDVEATNAETRRVSFVDGTKFNDKTGDGSSRLPTHTPRLDFDTDGDGFGSGLSSSFGNSDDGFGGFGSSFGSVQTSSSVRNMIDTPPSWNSN